MTGDVSGIDKLVEGILQDAQAEADTIIAEARAFTERQNNSAEQQIARVSGEAEEKAVEQISHIKKSNEQAIRVEKRRNMLSAQGYLVQMIEDRVRTAFEDAIDTSEYRSILLGWITEACIGLNATEMVVSVSDREKQYLDEEMLHEVEFEVKKHSGFDIHLEREDGNSTAGLGVVVIAADGRTAYNNQLSTRMSRYQSEIRKMVSVVVPEEKVPEGKNHG